MLKGCGAAGLRDCGAAGSYSEAKAVNNEEAEPLIIHHSRTSERASGSAKSLRVRGCILLALLLALTTYTTPLHI